MNPTFRTIPLSIPSVAGIDNGSFFADHPSAKGAAGIRITLPGLSLYVAVARAGPPRRRTRHRRRHLIARLLCEHQFYYSWRKARILCVECGALRPIP